MKNELIGIVSETRGDYAFVRPTNHTSCDSGHCCQGDGISKVLIEVRNEINADVGDKVIFEAKEVGMIKVAIIIFCLPLILASLGSILGWYMSNAVGISGQTTSIIGGIMFFIISIIMIRMYEKYVSENSKLKPVILRKI